MERFAATPHVEKPIHKTAANSPPCFRKTQQSASTGARFTGASALPNTSGGDGPSRRRSRLSGRRENWRNVVVLARVSLKGSSVVEICVHRRSFYGSERVAEHKRRRWNFASPLKGERAPRKLEERRRSCARILEGPICCRNLRAQALVLRKRARCRTQTAAMELCGAARG